MIALMSRVELVCLRSIRAELVRTLQDRGLLHLDEVGLEVEEAPEYLSRVTLEGEEYDELVRTEDADRTLAEVMPLITTQPSEFDVQAAVERISSLEQSELFSKVQGWAEQLRDTTRQRATAQDQLEVLNNYRVVIEQVAPSLGSDVKLGKGTRALVLGGDVARTASRIEERFSSEFAGEYSFHKNQTSKKHLVGLLTFPEDKSDVVSRILSQEGVAPMDMSSEDYSDLTATEVLDKIKATIANLQSELGRLEGEANTISQQVGADALAARSLVGDAVARLRVAGNFAQSEMIAVIQGWTPSDEYDALKSVIDAEFADKVDVNKIDAGDTHHNAIPTLLQNHKLIKPFEVCMSIFRPPSYGTIDPTAMVAVAFILFYGLILGDVVYGIAVIGLAKFLGRKLGHIPAVRDVEKIGTYMGISGAIFGVIYGEYCGDLLERIWPVVVGSEFHLYLFHRAHHPETLLIWAIYVGIFHIVAGMVLGVKEDFRHGHTTHALEKLGLLLSLIALIIQSFAYFDKGPFGAQIFTVISVVFFAVGTVLIFYSMRWMGLIGMIEIMSLGGNVLSYARLMALGVASFVIADIANTLPDMMGYWIGIPMAFAVHVMNIGIGIASPTIHSLRLNFVEFLPKFYTPEGTGFTPFKKETVS
jgi:V/A-type H+-transporting ATPase subunit I